MDKVPKKFFDAIQSKECILFVGSGISGWSGLPTWYELIKQLIVFVESYGLSDLDKKQLESILDKDLIQAASLAHSYLRKDNFREFLDLTFIQSKPKPSKIHDIIVTLGPVCYITTNYDRLIDDSYRENHPGSYLTSVNNDQIPEQAKIVRNDSSEFIFTPHGRADRSQTVVFTTDDYRKFKAANNPALTTLRYLLLSRPVIYLGFGLKDPDFIAIKDEIGQIYQGGEREHFAIIPDLCELEKKYIKETYGITVISYETVNECSSQNCGSYTKKQTHEGLYTLIKEIQDTIQKSQNRLTSLELPCESSSFIISTNSLIRHCEALSFGYPDLKQNHFKQYLKTNQSFSDYKKIKDNPIVRLNLNPERIEIDDFFDLPLNCILIGSPGSGKSHTVLQYSKKLARKTLSYLKKHSISAYSDIPQKIPLVLPMREYSGDIKEMISSYLLKSIEIAGSLENGIFTIIFDGVNEVDREYIDKKLLENNLLWFLTKYPKNRFIFTSRTKDYLNFLDYLVVELQPIGYFEIHEILKNEGKILLGAQPQNIQKILSTPLFLNIYLKSIHDRSNIFNITSLLSQYFVRSERELNQRNLLFNIPLLTILSPIAFDIIEKGVQTIPYTEIYELIKKREIANEVQIDQILQNLLINGILIPDSNGNLGFFHQTFLEFLAANELVKKYEENPTIIDNKIDYYRWDETIILFIGLLPEDKAILILNKLADKDIIFACKAFDTSIHKDRKYGEFLFELIIEKLSQKDITFVEKTGLVTGLRYVADFGPSDKIVRLLSDDDISDKIASIVANLNKIEAIPKLIELVKNDNMSPSRFAIALSFLVDETYIPALIKIYIESEDDKSLLPLNIVYILDSFKNNQLLKKEIEILLNSKNKIEKKLGLNLIKHLPKDLCNYYFEKELMNTESEHIFELLLNFSSVKGIIDINRNIEKSLFNLLLDHKYGPLAADCIIEINDTEIFKESEKRLIISKNDYEKINLCSIIAQYNPELAKKIIFDYLNNFNTNFSNELNEALFKFNQYFILPDLLSLFLQPSPKLQLFLCASIRMLLLNDEKIEISDEICQQLFKILENHFSDVTNFETPPNWEYFQIGFFLADNCSSISKPYFIEKINDPDYPYKENILGFVSQLPLQKKDFTDQTISWLLDKLKEPSDNYRFSRSGYGEILGKILDEPDIPKLLTEFGKTNESSYRNNISFVIEDVKSRLGKRVIDPL